MLVTACGLGRWCNLKNPRKIFASATRKTVYAQQGAKPACQEDIRAKFSHLLLAQLRRTQFTHSKRPNPRARKTSTEYFRISYWRSRPERNLHTASGAKPECQEDIHAEFSHLLLAQLPGTQFTHSKAPNPHARKTSTQNFHISYWRSRPEHNLHTAKRQTRVPGRHQRKIFASPFGAATRNTIYTQQGAKPACQEDINPKLSHSYPERAIYTQQGAEPACQEDARAKFSHLLFAQLPGTQLTHGKLPATQFTHSKAPNPRARKTPTQNFHISAHLPQTQFTHTKPPNPHARKTSAQNFPISFWRTAAGPKTR